MALKVSFDTIKSQYIEVINKISPKHKEIYTFEFCTSRGYELSRSTIDKIVVANNNRDVRIYFNENEDDYSYIESFPTNELLDFLYGFISYVLDDTDEAALDVSVLDYLNEKTAEFFKLVESISNEGKREFYDSFPNSDLFAIVCEECQKATILDMAEQFIDEDDIRDFLLACLGCDIE